MYRARAVRWEDGRDSTSRGLEIQVWSFDTAERQVRDYIETAMGADTAGAEIAIEKADPLKRNVSESIDKDKRPGQ